MTKIKICGLSRREDIESVNMVSPDYIGFIMGFPKSHRNITIERAKTLRAGLKEEIRLWVYLLMQRFLRLSMPVPKR